MKQFDSTRPDFIPYGFGHGGDVDHEQVVVAFEIPLHRFVMLISRQRGEISVKPRGALVEQPAIEPLITRGGFSGREFWRNEVCEITGLSAFYRQFRQRLRAMELAHLGSLLVVPVAAVKTRVTPSSGSQLKPRFFFDRYLGRAPIPVGRPGTSGPKSQIRLSWQSQR